MTSAQASGGTGPLCRRRKAACARRQAANRDSSSSTLGVLSACTNTCPCHWDGCSHGLLTFREAGAPGAAPTSRAGAQRGAPLLGRAAEPPTSPPCAGSGQLDPRNRSPGCPSALLKPLWGLGSCCASVGEPASHCVQLAPRSPCALAQPGSAGQMLGAAQRLGAHTPCSAAAAAAPARPRRPARLHVAAAAGQGRPPPAEGNLRSPAGQAQRQAILGRIDSLIDEELQSDNAVSWHTTRVGVPGRLSLLLAAGALPLPTTSYLIPAADSALVRDPPGRRLPGEPAARAASRV